MTGHFAKPPFTIPEQIQRLRQKGMVIEDAKTAAYWLTHVSYYRLSAYWLYYEGPKDKGDPCFSAGTTFADVTALYDFDRELRRLVMRGSEHVEVALRGSWAYTLAHNGGSHAYLTARHYKDRKQFHRNLSKLVGEVGYSSETYIKHYRNAYDEPSMPPVWMVSEMMSFGQLSRWFSNLQERRIRNNISEPLGLPETVLVPLISHVTDIRNICAHHGRLWNRQFLRPPRLAEKPESLKLSLNHKSNQAPAKLYNGLTMIAHVVQTVAPDSTWIADLAAHVKTLPNGDLSAMGFPPDWTMRPIWKTD